MNEGRTVFSQVMQTFHRQEFQRCVTRYGGDHRIHSFSCRDQFLAMSFAQLTFRESLRDIEVCLASRADQLYHLGFRSRVARSTLAEANEKRDWRIYADLAHRLIPRARALYQDESLEVDLDETIYAFDASTIDLSLSVFPWAWAQQHKSAVKLNTLLDLRGSIPTFLRITAGRAHDVLALDHLPVEAGAFYGNSFNAVRTQIWIAVCVYLQVAILKKQLNLSQSLHTILHVLSVSVFEKVPIYQLFTDSPPQTLKDRSDNQLKIWDL